jgi:tetratricopeptide (TPR) repeat protein
VELERQELKARLEEKRKLALERLEEARREVAEETKAAETALAKRKAWLSGKKVTLSVRGGETFEGVEVRETTPQDVEIAAPAGRRRLRWDVLKPESFRSATPTLFDPADARDQFDSGRAFIAARLWKDALEAFDRAAKLGDGFDSRVDGFRDVLERIASGRGPFHAVLSQAGPDLMMLSYDLETASQLEDFSPGLVLSGRAAVLEAKPRASIFLMQNTGEGDAREAVAFVHDLGLALRVSTTGTFTVGLFAGPRGGYEVDLGPAGATLYSIDPDAPEKSRRKKLASQDRLKLAPGRVSEVRLEVHGRRLTLKIDGEEALSSEDAVTKATDRPPEGGLKISIEQGTLRIEAPWSIQGHLRPGDVSRRVSEIEVRLRQALDEELREIEERRQRKVARVDDVDTELSVDNPFFARKITVWADIKQYGDLRKELFGLFSGHPVPDWSMAKWKSSLDPLIAKYPDAPVLLYLRALAQVELQEVSTARSDLRRTLEIFPDFYEALVLQSKLCWWESDQEGAFKAANRAIELMPDYAPAYVRRAMAGFTNARGARESFFSDLALAKHLDPDGHEAAQMARMFRARTKGPRDLGCRFDAETPHYSITTDISPEVAQQYGDRLEVVFAHYAEVLKKFYTPGPMRKPRVTVFASASNYYAYFSLLSEDRGEHTLGVYRPALNEFVLFESTDVDETLHTLYHEAFHHFVTLLAGYSVPTWFNEGMAEYMGAIRVKDGRVAERNRVLLGRYLLIRQMIDEDRSVPFREILQEGAHEFYGPKSGVNYAQAWSMIHFLFEYQNGKYRSRIDRYMEALRDQKSLPQCYEAVFAADAETLEKEWKEFVRTLKP